MIEPGPGEVEVFYGDAMDEDGNVVASVKMELLGYSGFEKVTVTKIPVEEMVLDDAKRIRLGDD